MISERIQKVLAANPGAFVTARGVEIKRTKGTELLVSIRGLQTGEEAPVAPAAPAAVTTPAEEAKEPEKAEEKPAAPAPAPKKPGPKPKAQAEAPKE